MNKYMEIAITLANKNLKKRYGGPFGAVVVRNGKIIGQAANMVIKNNDPTAHAEIMAIRNACKKIKSHDLGDCELYTSCFPCPMCMGAIIWANIKTVYYGNTKQDAANIGFRDDFIYDFLNGFGRGKIDTHVLKLKPLNRKYTIKSFKEFEKMPDKVAY